MGKTWRSAKRYDKELAADSTVTAAGHPAPLDVHSAWLELQTKAKTVSTAKMPMPLKGHQKQDWGDGEINAKCLNSSTLAILYAF